MKKVSVIIPCFNATKWLPKCFMSLVQQCIGIAQLELIFVDDASTDNGATWQMLQEFERAFPESILILQLEENMRQGGARNIALQYATGEYIAFVILSLRIFWKKPIAMRNMKMQTWYSLNMNFIQTGSVQFLPEERSHRKSSRSTPMTSVPVF